MLFHVEKTIGATYSSNIAGDADLFKRHIVQITAAKKQKAKISQGK